MDYQVRQDGNHHPVERVPVLLTEGALTVVLLHCEQGHADDCVSPSAALGGSVVRAKIAWVDTSSPLGEFMITVLGDLRCPTQLLSYGRTPTSHTVQSLASFFESWCKAADGLGQTDRLELVSEANALGPVPIAVPPWVLEQE